MFVGFGTLKCIIRTRCSVSAVTYMYFKHSIQTNTLATIKLTHLINYCTKYEINIDWSNRSWVLLMKCTRTYSPLSCKPSHKWELAPLHVNKFWCQSLEKYSYQKIKNPKIHFTFTRTYIEYDEVHFMFREKMLKVKLMNTTCK